MLKSIIFTLLLATTLLTTANGFFWNKDKVLLKDVDVLILHAGRMTTGRRKPPVPQLNCVGGIKNFSFNCTFYNQSFLLVINFKQFNLN